MKGMTDTDGRPFGAPAPRPHYENDDRPRAGVWSRITAWLVDCGLVVGLPLIILVLSGAPSGAGAIVFYLIVLDIALALYCGALMGGRAGRTLGMRALRIRLIDKESLAPVGFWRAFWRSLLGIWISTPLLLLGYLWMISDADVQTWHDKVFNTIVVPLSAYPVGSEAKEPETKNRSSGRRLGRESKGSVGA